MSSVIQKCVTCNKLRGRMKEQKMSNLPADRLTPGPPFTNVDALLLKTNGSHLSHEVLVTLMSEVMAIMNARPLVPVSSDPDMPSVLTPAMLLTQKAEPVLPPPGQYDLKEIGRASCRERV